jgi:group I intron endonuclease
MATGIYIIKNKVTGDSYVGSASVCFKSRWGYHTRDLRANKHHSPRLQNSWNKYGADSFEFSILEECGPEVCIAREQFYLDTLRPELNICKIAGSCLGVKHSEETRKRMSISKKGKVSPRKGVVLSEEVKLKMSLAKKGKPSKRKNYKHSEEVRMKIAEHNRTRVRVYTEETRKKLSDAANKRWSKKCPAS